MNRISPVDNGSTLRVTVAGLSVVQAGKLVESAIREAVAGLTKRAQQRRFRLPWTMSFAEADGCPDVFSPEPLFQALESGRSPVSCVVKLADSRGRRAAVRFEVIGIPETICGESCGCHKRRGSTESPLRAAS